MITRSILAAACLTTLCACQSPRPSSSTDLVADAKTRVTQVDAARFATENSSSTVIIDVREPAEFAAGHLPGAKNLPRGLLEFRIASVDGLEGMSEDQRLQQPIAVYCRSGARAALAADTLQKMGYTNVRSIEGGFKAWQAQDLPVEKAAD